MSYAEFEVDSVIDARNCIMGRVASNVAQRTLEGERIAVVNAEDAVITGSDESVMDVYRTRAELGSDQGPNYPSRPDGIFKRAIRGMLPYKKQRGRQALSNVRVYVGNPYDVDGEAVEGTTLDRLSNIKFVSLGTIAENLGSKVTW
jgi:large subunit ribosomal protein L13